MTSHQAAEIIQLLWCILIVLGFLLGVTGVMAGYLLARSYLARKAAEAELQRERDQVIRRLT